MAMTGICQPVKPIGRNINEMKPPNDARKLSEILSASRYSKPKPNERANHSAAETALNTAIVFIINVLRRKFNCFAQTSKLGILSGGSSNTNTFVKTGLLFE